MPIEKGALVCVTGANGFVASYVIRDLLAAGYRVRGTVRDPSNKAKTAHLQALEGSANLELVAADLMQDGSFDAAMSGCDAAIHCAAAVFFAAKDPQKDLVDPSVQGTLNALRAAQKSGSIQRFVHTSSVAAIYDWNAAPDHVFTEDDWNESSKLANDPYAVAKVSAERAAVEFVDNLAENERFELVHLNPGMVWGPPMIKAHAGASPALIRDIISRKHPGSPHLWMSVVDVRDVAHAHVLAMEHADPPTRCILVSDNGWIDDMARQVQAMHPDVKMATRTLPKFAILIAALVDASLNPRQLRHLIGRELPMDGSLSKRAYGMTYRPLDELLRDTASALIDNEWARVNR